MKTAKDYLDSANEDVPKMDAKDAIAKHATGKGVFIDVRDSADIAKSGTIKGAHRVPRGMIEFRADPAVEALYDATFQKDAEIYLVCGAGGQAALAGKTLKDMGYENVTNIGGFPGWKDAGGPTEA
ncbi:rhodanese-like domain-containing protein [Sulfitobacter guttiformis]|uniref:Rhodanese-related sulfurtransferase n=1 Tax=Sulfitobacter guttiformis TaxID=74349 RepID=A0A420DPY9_9RHOB|nr:rhodanese-like domain-containing protein [Sulfitobacter guttiformis]KIN73581.1 Rhodanese domain protein [Sulfitobacter guttiformis KCTC 32187]RKE96229.1 rhodanese-related sulfurtransferase [Sulfitobacter guttiformis]